LNKNQYKKSIQLCCSESKINTWNRSRSVAAYSSDRPTCVYCRWNGG